MQMHTVHTGFVQVVRQLYRRLHLHVGLEDAAADYIQAKCTLDTDLNTPYALSMHTGTSS